MTPFREAAKKDYRMATDYSQKTLYGGWDYLVPNDKRITNWAAAGVNWLQGVEPVLQGVNSVMVPYDATLVNSQS